MTTYTKDKAREFLRGKYVKVTGLESSEKVQAKLSECGLKKVLWQPPYGYPFSIAVDGKKYSNFNMVTAKGYSEIKLTDLLQIEIIDENPLKMNPEAIREFVKEVQNEFADMNLEYLTYKADMFIENNTVKFETDYKGKYEAAVLLIEKIKNWELPKTGKFWDDESPMSYTAAYGSNGVRDYFKGLAEDFLAQHNQENP